MRPVPSAPSSVVEPRRRRRQATLTGLLMTLGSSYVALLLGIVQGILVMRMIGPTGRGLQRLVDLFNKWLSNAHLGALHGLSKQLPLTLGRGEESQAQEIEEVGAVAVVGLGLAGSLAMLGYALWGPGVAPVTRQVLALGAAIVWTGHTYSLYRVVLRAWGTYSVLALGSLVTTIGGFVLVVGGGHFFGVRGVVAGWLGGNLLQLAYLATASGFRIRPRINWGTIWYLIRAGLPLWGVVFADILLRTVDGVVVVRFTDAYRFGLYSLAMQMGVYLYRIPEGLGFVIMPRIWESYGAANGAGPLRQQVLIPTLATATVMPVLGGIAFILTPYLVHNIVPRFAPGAFAAQILCLGATLLALPVAANGLLVAMNREWWVAGSKLGGAAVAGVGAGWVLTRGGSLAQVAMFTCLGYAVAGGVALTIALRQYYHSPAAVLRELIICHLPVLYVLAAVRVAGTLAAVALGPASGEWGEAALRVVLFVVLCAPLLWYGDRRTGVLARLRRALAERLGRGREPSPPAEGAE